MRKDELKITNNSPIKLFNPNNSKRLTKTALQPNDHMISTTKYGHGAITANKTYINYKFLILSSI